MENVSQEEVALQIRGFVERCEQPLVFEKGAAPFALLHGEYQLGEVNGRLLLEVWDDQRLLRRRLKKVMRASDGRLEVEAEKFGKRPATVVFTDIATWRGMQLLGKAEKLEFRERFRRMLEREWPGWEITACSVEQDLMRSLSSSVARAALKKGQTRIAAVGVDTPEAALMGSTLALLWGQQVLAKEKRERRVALFIPPESCAEVLQRIEFLPGAESCRWQWLVFVHEEGRARAVDVADRGNVITRVDEFRTWRHRVDGPVLQMLESLATLAHVELVDLPQGEVSARVKGKEFARTVNGVLQYGLDEKRVWTPNLRVDLAAFSRQVAGLRGSRRQTRLGLSDAERWLESQVRRELAAVDPTLEAGLIHGQVPVLQGRSRNVMDLVALDAWGRLAVLELKAKEDLTLPLQALDYWICVRHHAALGHFAGKGYFQGRDVGREAPRLLLVAPALEFHATTEAILRNFAPEVDVIRVGLGVEWQEHLKVAFRLRREERPDEHFSEAVGGQAMASSGGPASKVFG